MTNLVQNWLKLNKLLDKYQKEERDLTPVIHSNVQLDSILVDTFTSANNTAVHYAAVALPKLLSFPSAMVIFSSLEKSSIILRSILLAVGSARGEDRDTGAELDKCLARFVAHYSHLQVNCPNIRRVCGVFCLNLLDVSVEFIDKSNRAVECSDMKSLLENALFHTSLSEDYANFFSKKFRKTEHIQKLFSVLKKQGDKEDPTHFYNSLPEIHRAFLNAYPQFQPKCIKFHLTAFTLFIDGLNINSIHSDSIQLIGSRLVCLGQLLESLEICFRVFPNDPELISAQTETFSPIISKLIELYPEYPSETGSCIISIQKMNHIIMEEHLRIIFEKVFRTGVGNSTLLNHIFQIYSRLNQLDKLVQIIMESVEELDKIRIISIPEFNSAVQNIFSATSLGLCNKCIKLLLVRISRNNSLYILCELLYHILSVAPAGELSNTSPQRDAYLQLLGQLNELLHRYASVKLTSNTETVFALSFYFLLDSFIGSLLLINNLPFSREWVKSIEHVNLTQIDIDFIPTNWGKKCGVFLSNMDEHVLKRIQDIELDILLALSRFSQSDFPPIAITYESVFELLSDRVTRTITTSSGPDLVGNILQYSQRILNQLTHAAKLQLSQYIIHFMVNNSCEHDSSNNLEHIITSNQFKEITSLHPYIAYNTTHQILNLLDSKQDIDSTFVAELKEFYNTIINQLGERLKDEKVTYHELACPVIQLVGRNLVSRGEFDGTEQEEVAKLVNLFDILPLYYLTIEVKLNLLIALQSLTAVLGVHKEMAERITIYSTTLLRGFNDNVPRSGVKIKHIQEYMCTLELFTKYIYRIAYENKMDTAICYKLFEEISAFTFERIPVQFNSLAQYASGIWEELLNTKPVIQPHGLLLELTRSLIRRVVSMWSGFKHKSDNMQGDLLLSLNTMIEISTPILLKQLKHSTNKLSLQLLSMNLKYIFLSRQTEAGPPIEEAIMEITSCTLEFIREDTIDDVITLESICFIAETLRQYRYTVSTLLEDKISALMLPVHNLGCEVGMSHLDNTENPVNIGSDRYLLTKKCVIGLIGCTDTESNKVLISRIIDKFEKEYSSCCHLLSWMIEGNIPDSHRSEIRKVFKKLLSIITHYLMDRKIEEKDSFITLRLLTSILKLPSSIGLSSRLFAEVLTPLSLIALDNLTQTQEFSLIFQAKSQCLYYCLRNYPDNTTSCIPVFLLLTHELISSAFALTDNNSTELTALVRLLEAYTAHTVLSNYTYHIIQQYINNAQKWSQKQATKKALKPSIFALIGFSKPETLLALQAQLDSTGRSYYAEMKEEYEKFYRFRGKT